MNSLKFGVYKYHIVCADGALLRKQLIVLQDRDRPGRLPECGHHRLD